MGGSATTGQSVISMPQATRAQSVFSYYRGSADYREGGDTRGTRYPIRLHRCDTCTGHRDWDKVQCTDDAFRATPFAHLVPAARLSAQCHLVMT